MKTLHWSLLGFLGVLAGVGDAAGEWEVRTESGPVVAEVRLGPVDPRLGDPLELELEVRAQPGVEVWMPEFGDALGRFSIVDFVPSDSLDDEGGFVGRQRYVLTPPRSGSQRVPPLLIEFVDRRPGQAPAPEGEDAHSVLTEAIDFEVASVLAEGASLDLRPPKGALAPRRDPVPDSWLFALAGVVAVAATLFGGVLLLRRSGRRASAYEVARQALDALAEQPPPPVSEIDAFFVEVSGIARRYLEGHFGFRAPELTTEEFLEDMSQSPDLSREHRELVASLLRRADLVKFARERPDSDGAIGFVREVERFVEETGAPTAQHPPVGAA